MFSSWVGDLYVWANLVDGMNLLVELVTVNNEWLPGINGCQNVTIFSHSVASWIVTCHNSKQYSDNSK